MPVTASYLIASDSWYLAYQLEDVFVPSGDEPPTPLAVPDGDWTAFTAVSSVGPNAGIGLSVELASGDLLELWAHQNPPPDQPAGFYVEWSPGTQTTLRATYDGGLLSLSIPSALSDGSEDMADWVEVAAFTLDKPSLTPTKVGLVLRYDRPDFPADGIASAVRLLNGVWENVSEEVWIPEPETSAARIASRAGGPPSVTVFSTSEPPVHAIIGAQFGDLEFDVGKSVRWVTWFLDNVFVLDVNLGTPRYWIVNWAETFPDAEHAVTSINYFVVPTEFRKEQWKQYCLAFGTPEDDEWILFIDAHEGLGVDNRTLPDDYDFAPFKSFLWREIQRAQDLGQSSAVLPYYVFLRSDHIVNVTYPMTYTDPEIPPVLQALSTPYYQGYQGLRRLWNAAALKNPSFDWSQLDTVATPSANCKLQILSYGYAHWNLQDIVPPATQVEPLDANNDDGYRMRQLLSRVRPVPGLPVSDTWISPSSDPAGLAGPWSPADANNPDPVDPVTGALMPQPVTPNSALLGLVTPLYDCVFRINMRDGVWYENDDPKVQISGNIPLKWDGTKWVTEYVPDNWHDTGSGGGVASHDPYYDASTP